MQGLPSYLSANIKVIFSLPAPETSLWLSEGLLPKQLLSSSKSGKSKKNTGLIYLIVTGRAKENESDGAISEGDDKRSAL